MLKTEKPDGLAYVETSALDGERNLKPRFAPMEIQLGFTEIFCLVNKKQNQMKIETILPNKDLNNFEGLIEICGC